MQPSVGILFLLVLAHRVTSLHATARTMLQPTRGQLNNFMSDSASAGTATNSSSSSKFRHIINESSPLFVDHGHHRMAKGKRHRAHDHDSSSTGLSRSARSSGELMRRPVGAVAANKNITFALLLPRTLPMVPHTDVPSLVLTAMELAVRKLKEPNGLLADYNVAYEYADTKCSSTYGPMAAFDLVVLRKPNAFFGLMCNYVLAPVSRYSGVWGIPVLTAGGVVETFNHKPLYPTLIRMLVDLHIGHAVKEILAQFNWNIAAIVYHNHDEKATKGYSDCSLAMAAVYRALNSSESVHHEFDETTASREKLLDTLSFAKRNARSKFN